MIRIGVDVGGTNTDAVVMKGQDFLGGAKSTTTADILSGVESLLFMCWTPTPFIKFYCF